MFHDLRGVDPGQHTALKTPASEKEKQKKRESELSVKDIEGVEGP